MRKSEISKNLSLAWMLARLDIKNRYVSSYAGALWAIGVPLLYALINVVVFSILMKGRMGAAYGEVPFVLFYFVPYSLWAFFSEVVGRSTSILKEYGYLINKIAFPFWVLPLVPIASALLTQGILLFLISVVMVKNSIVPAGSVFLYIPIWMISLFITLGVAYGISALTAYVPDLAQAVPVVINIMFWLTPILYPPVLVEDGGMLWVRALIMDFNPFFYLVEMSRQAVFGAAKVSLSMLAGMAVFSLLVFVAGISLFRKLKSGFADVI